MDMSGSLHSKNAEPGLFDRRVERGGNRERQDAPRFAGRDHSVVPKPRGGIVGMPLPLVLVEDGALEFFLLLLAPGAALGLYPVPLHLAEEETGLLPPPHRIPG